MKFLCCRAAITIDDLPQVNVMDLERIKQNLRLRSGRSKKTRKPPVAQPNTSIQATQANEKNTANGQAIEHSRATKQQPPSNEKLSTTDTSRKAESTAQSPNESGQDPKHRPGLPHASTGSDPKSSQKSPPARFGRSGIERPQKQNLGEPKLLRTMSEAANGSSAANDDSSSALDFDLRPPAPRPKPLSIDSLAESLFSAGHLNVLLRDPQYLARFTAFLTKYRPQYHPVLLRYLETQKAIKAIEYANAVAEGVPIPTDDKDNGDSTPLVSVAAILDKAFEESSTAAFRLMVDSALPMYITYNLVKLATECLINEITGRKTPLMQGLVGGLSEVFCLTDPKQKDNPIIYASEEFYRYTGYGPDDVIGNNCRFLQGSKTMRESVARLKQAISKEEGLCETLLNYRRDGRPFINLLLIAPLHDDKGNVKYYIGAQVDVTGLVSRAKSLDGFERYLISREIERREEKTRGREPRPDQGFRKPRALAKLRELSEMFDLEESAVVRTGSRSASASGDEDERSNSSSRKGGRRVLRESDSSDNEDEDVDEAELKTWKLGQSGRSGLSGQLPGVYESYMLLRPAPSLRIIFVSPKLRRRLGNVLQHPFLSHLGASTNTLSGLKESFDTGVSVSAKVNFLLEAGNRREGTIMRAGSRLEDVGHGRVCWISATPLLGGDDKIGVWMIVVVERNKVPSKPKHEALVRTGDNQALQQTKPDEARQSQESPTASFQQKPNDTSNSVPKSEQDTQDIPIKPKKLAEDPEPNHDAHPQAADKKTNEGSEAPNHQHVLSEPQKSATPNGGAESDDKSPGSQDSSNEELHDAEEDFVKTETQQPAPEPPNQPRSGDDATDDVATSPGTAVVEDHKDSTPDEGRTEAQVKPKSFGEEDPRNGSVGSHSPSDHEDTVVNHNREDSSDGTPSPSRPGTSGKDSASGGDKNIMDYLRHPGTRTSGEYNRAVSGNFLSTRYELKDGDEDEGDGFDDPDCPSSPYSID